MGLEPTKPLRWQRNALPIELHPHMVVQVKQTTELPIHKVIYSIFLLNTMNVYIFSHSSSV